MADLSPAQEATHLPAMGGVFGRLARQQYRALATMRWRMFVIGLRSIRGILELGANGIQLMVFSFIGIVLGLGLGFVSYSLVRHGSWEYIPVEFWVVLFVWQTIPVTLASFQDQFDMTGLLRFPLSFGSFFVLYLVFGLLDISTVMGGICCLAILIGISAAQHALMAWTALALLGFAVFNILLARAILAWVDRWLSQRRTREIVSALFLLCAVSLQLLNPAVRGQGFDAPTREQRAARRHERPSALDPILQKTKAVQPWLPPGMTAGVLQDASQEKPAVAIGAMAGLGLYALGIGGLLAIRLRAEFRGENLGEAPSRAKQEAAEQRHWLMGRGGPIAATIEKELQTLIRSMPQLYALAVPVVMVFVVGSLFRNSVGPVRHPFPYALPVCVAYGLLGFTRVIYNNLGTEGTGIQLLFMSPTPIRSVMLAKNLFHGGLYLMMAVLSGATAWMRLGAQSSALVVMTAAWLLFALPANLTVGNIMSLTMAYRVNPGRITRQPGSQGNALLGMLVQVLLLGVGGAVIGFCAIADKAWLATPILLACAGIATVVWMRVLANMDTLANDRRDILISVLAKVG